jgi:hypothetical protein
MVFSFVLFSRTKPGGISTPEPPVHIVNTYVMSPSSSRVQTVQSMKAASCKNLQRQRVASKKPQKHKPSQSQEVCNDNMQGRQKEKDQ